MRKNKKEPSVDPRVKCKLSYWYGFLVIFWVLIALAVAQALIYNRYVGINHMPLKRP